MGVNRSGYYKWRQRKGTPNRHEQNRIVLTELLRTAHEKHPSHGYHRLALDVFSETGWVFSHNLAHKCCKAAGIRSKARKHRYQPPGEESVLFANEVRGRWNATRPLQLVVSDMTMFKVGNTYWEWTILLDTFNNEILAHSVTSQAGSNKPYYHCLEELKKRMDKREEQTSQLVLHTDQGAVYSSQAFCQAHHDYNILRSMSRGGTPTDNPIIEALNGWIKEELYLDFGLAHADNIPALLENYVHFFNHDRPAAALGYKSPVQYRSERGFLEIACLCLLLLDKCTVQRTGAGFVFIVGQSVLSGLFPQARSRQGWQLRTQYFSSRASCPKGSVRTGWTMRNR